MAHKVVLWSAPYTEVNYQRISSPGSSGFLEHLYTDTSDLLAPQLLTGCDEDKTPDLTEERKKKKVNSGWFRLHRVMSYIVVE